MKQQKETSTETNVHTNLQAQLTESSPSPPVLQHSHIVIIVEELNFLLKLFLFSTRL